MIELYPVSHQDLVEQLLNNINTPKPILKGLSIDLARKKTILSLIPKQGRAWIGRLNMLFYLNLVNLSPNDVYTLFIKYRIYLGSRHYGLSRNIFNYDDLLHCPLNYQVYYYEKDFPSLVLANALTPESETTCFKATHDD